MAFVSLRSIATAVTVSLCAIGTPALAQRPTTQQAEALLRSRPDLVQMLRQRVAQSGLTREQIHARLRAEGYPEDLLDAYLPGETLDKAATVAPARQDSVLVAAQELGLATMSDLDLAGIVCDDSVAAVTPADSNRANRPRRCRPAGSASEARRPAEIDSGFVIFGLDVFRSATNQFDPNTAGPVDPGYRFGPGDQLSLIMTGDVEQSIALSVSREGYIVIPQVGQIYVNNLTLAELERVLRSRLSRSYSGIEAGTLRFSIGVTGLRSVQVYVLGDVARPGSYRIASTGTALTALYSAGGPTRNGSMRSVEIRRGGRSVETLDVYEYLLRGDASHDPRLQNGDVVFVPVHGARVRVTGEVIRPATYELKGSETLADLLRNAGGFTETAARRRVQVERIIPAPQRTAPGRDRVVLDVASDEFATGYGPALPLQPGDIVRVFTVNSRLRNRIAVKGNVWTPGVQGFTPGMTLSQALKAAGGVRPNVYTGQVLITRLQSDSTRIQLRTSLADTLGTPTQDLALREDDEIQVFSITDFRPDRYVVISGAVRNNGRFSYREGMTLRDLVLLSGGLTPGAYLNEAEVARLPADRSGGTTASTVRVPLDSSYVFGRGTDGGFAGPPGLPGPPGTAPDVPLRPYDNVLILYQPNFELPRTVVLGGEVRFPGRYTLTSRTERVSDLVRRAGGLTNEAYPEGVTFYRKADNVGRIGIDLSRALRNDRDRDNLILQDGDSIVVPQYKAVVLVSGQVNAPVAVAYVPGANTDYYIAAAGGATRQGDRARAYVVQPNGKVESAHVRFSFIPDYKPTPGGGSTVIVPQRDPSDVTNYFGMLTQVAGAITTAITTYLVIKQVSQ